MHNSALLFEHDITPGETEICVVGCITPEWRRYELNFSNVAPQSGFEVAHGVDRAMIFMHLSGDNGATYDEVMDNYTFGRVYICPDGSVNGFPKIDDAEFELSWQNDDTLGFCGKMEFSNPLRDGVKKSFRSFGTYHGPARFCIEMAGYMYRPTTPVNALRIRFYPPVPGGWPFAGGSVSLWGYR